MIKQMEINWMSECLNDWLNKWKLTHPNNYANYSIKWVFIMFNKPISHSYNKQLIVAKRINY